MYLPKRLYEALPFVYIAIGTLLVSGSTYIGLDHGPAASYFALGLASVVYGVAIQSIRRKARSKRVRS